MQRKLIIVALVIILGVAGALLYPKKAGPEDTVDDAASASGLLSE